jgi:hypothetical protein
VQWPQADPLRRRDLVVGDITGVGTSLCPGRGRCGSVRYRPPVTSDLAEIGRLMSRFLSAVSFKQGEQPSYGDLPNLFALDARLIRNSGVAPETLTVDEFVIARQRAVDTGELTSFQETELTETTELFGNVAHRFSTYAKQGVTNGYAIDVRGAISTQFIRTPDGWRISSMAWDDERPGLAVSPAVP